MGKLKDMFEGKVKECYEAKGSSFVAEGQAATDIFMMLVRGEITEEDQQKVFNLYEKKIDEYYDKEREREKEREKRKDNKQELIEIINSLKTNFYR